MKTQNHVQLIGYLGHDPVIRTAKNGAMLARFRMATDYYRKKEDGTVVKKVTWHSVVVWEGLAERCPENFMKGSHVLVQGEICHRSYTDKAGVKRWICEIRGSKLLNLDR